MTALRGGLALWVVVYHFWTDIARLFPSLQWAAPFATRGNMAVPAFFMLSGYVLSYNYADQFQRISLQNAGKFVLFRLARIYPVHLASLLIVLAMVVVSHRLGFHLTDAGYTRADFVRNLLLIQTWVPKFALNWNYPSWSISSEWFAYLLFPLLVRFVLGRLTTARLAVTFGTLALLGSITLSAVGRTWPFYELLLVVPNFLIGASIHWMTNNPQSRFRSPRYLTDILAASIPLACFLHPWAYGHLHLDVPTVALLTLFSSVIFCLALQRNSCGPVWKSRPAVYLGEVSYSLYMTHTLVQKLVYKLLPLTLMVGAGVPTKLLTLGLYAVAIAAFCLGMYYGVEKPCREIFRRRKPLQRPVA